MANIKILHALLNQSRRTTVEHAVCFARHQQNNEIEFCNAFGPQNYEICDLLIVTYDLLALRNTPYWTYLRKIVLKHAGKASKVAYFPQDDYSSCFVLDNLYVMTPNCVVYSPIVNDLEVLYPKSLKKGIRFVEALTGYVDNQMGSLAEKYAKKFSLRKIDVGQRVRYLPPQFGKEAQLKGKIAIDFARLAAEEGFVCDVSTDPSKVLLGEKWHEFLGQTKFTVGGLGGASIADPRGLLADRVRRRTFRNSEMDMDELNRVFKERGGRRGDFGAISPRIFEAAALGVCQILFEANYVGTLEPWKHYIPLDKDLSNAIEVLRFMEDVDRCAEIAEQCKAALITSGLFSYEKFVSDFWARELDDNDTKTVKPSLKDSIGVMLPLFSNGRERQTRGAEYVRQEFVNGKKNQHDKFSSNIIEQSFFFEEVKALNFWLDGIRSREIILESLFISWASVRGSGWLENLSEDWD